MNRGPEELGYVEAELTLRRTEDGGRKTAIRSGYRPNWWLPGEAGHVWAGGSVEVVDDQGIAPGATGTIRIYPFAFEIWTSVRVGAPLEMCEGPVLIGKAKVTRVVPAAVPVGSL